MGRFWSVLGVAALVALGGCSSLGVGGGGPATTAAPSVAGLDAGRDDIAGAAVVFDLPEGVEPLPGASIIAFKLSAANGDSRRIDALLAPADADAVIGRLPPPGAGRTYYLFGFSPKDQLKLRDAQAWGRTQPVAPGLTVDLLPQLCATAPVKPAQASLAILAVLPDGRSVPLASRTVAELLAARGRDSLAACAGHSG